MNRTQSWTLLGRISLCTTKGGSRRAFSPLVTPSSPHVSHPYFTVYFGSWDEWVPTARLLKHNEANLALQKDLSRAQAAVTLASASASKTSNAVRGTQSGGGRRKEGGRGTKRGRDDDDGTRRPEMRLVVPDTLKVLLVDDWEAVTKNNQVRSSLAFHYNNVPGGDLLSSWSHSPEVQPSWRYWKNLKNIS